MPSTTRPKVPEATQASVLLQCRRRCSICYGLNRDNGEKRGQIAHIDRCRTNNSLGNLVFLCLEHHDEYDSSTRLSKGLTQTELRVFRAELIEALDAALRAPISLVPTASDVPPVWDGLYRWETEYACAEIRVSAVSQNKYEVHGMAFWGTMREYGPNIGELQASAFLENGLLTIREGDYVLALALISGGMVGTESEGIRPGLFGHNVTFAGTFRRVPVAAELIHQPPPRPFESEFWEEEGRPVFRSSAPLLVMRARLMQVHQSWQKSTPILTPRLNSMDSATALFGQVVSLHSSILK